jgi:hypothetical protein
MRRELLLKETIESLGQLTDQNLEQVSDFAKFLLSKVEDQLLTGEIQKLASSSDTFYFLDTYDDLYTVSDLKEKYQ